MAKRGAEALAYRAPWEGLLPHAPPPKRCRGHSEPREPRRAAPWNCGGSSRKRKRAEEEETEAAGGKRPAPAETNEPKGAEAGAASPQGSSRLLRQEEAASGRDLVGHWRELLASRLPSRGHHEEQEEEARWAPKPRPPSARAQVAQGGGPVALSQVYPQDENDVWHYNSFQYWRTPLPTIDLSDILDLEREDTVEARDSSSIGLSEMET